MSRATEGFSATTATVETAEGVDKGRFYCSERDTLAEIMSSPWIRTFCLSLPHVTEDVKWEKDLAFCIGKKMFAVTCLEPAAVVLSFKCTPETFSELTERPGIIPAPYLGRAHWVALENEDALTRKELEPLLRKAYELVQAKLPKKLQAGVGH